MGDKEIEAIAAILIAVIISFYNLFSKFKRDGSKIRGYEIPFHLIGGIFLIILAAIVFWATFIYKG